MVKIENDVKIFSYSKINTFTFCPYAYQQRYIEHITPKTKSPALSMGGSMAVGIASYRKTGDRKIALDAFASNGVSEGMCLTKKDDPRRSVERGAEILSAYMKAYPDEPEKIMKINGHALMEQNFKIPITRKDGTFFLFEGVIDAIQTGTNDKLELIEDKTTSRLGDTFFRRLKLSQQIAWYLMACADLGLITGNALKCRLNAIYIHPEKFRFERDITIKTPQYLDACRENLIDLVDQILYAEERGIFPRYGVDGDACMKFGGCDFLPLCNTRTSPSMFARVKETQYIEYKSRKERSE